MATIKGQNLRVLLGEDAEHLKCVAAATSCQVHLALQVAEDTTKDTDNDWIYQEPVGISWDAQVDALIVSNDDEDDAQMADALIPGMEYTLQFSRTRGAAGEKNRDAVADTIQLTGKAILSDLVFQSTNQEETTAVAKFTGNGDLVPTYSPSSSAITNGSNDPGAIGN